MLKVDDSPPSSDNHSAINEKKILDLDCALNPKLYLQLGLKGVALPLLQIFVCLFALPLFEDSLSKPPGSTFTQLAVAVLVPAINAAMLQMANRSETLAPRLLVPLAGVACGIAAVYIPVFLSLAGMFSVPGYALQAVVLCLVPDLFFCFGLARKTKILLQYVGKICLCIFAFGLLLALIWSNPSSLGMIPFIVLLVSLLCFGLVALSFFCAGPLLALSTSVELASRLMPSKSDDARALKGLALIGLISGIGLAFMSDMRTGVTRFALNRASDEDPLAARTALRLIRNFGNTECLIDSCHDQFAATLDLPALVFRNCGKVEDARKIYYRLTGEFCSMDNYHLHIDPVLASNANAIRSGVRERDKAIASEDVGPVMPGLSMTDSLMQVVPSVTAGVARATWKMRFANSADANQEARTEILLPRNGVVSKVSIWMHGVKQTADIEPRQAARAKYENVVLVRRRDPVLVTSTGPDKVLMQCFPVAPGGYMNIEIQADYPLTVDECNFTLPLPVMAAQNFTEATRHNIANEKGTIYATLTGEQLCHHRPATVCKFSGLTHSVLNEDRLANIKFAPVSKPGVSNLYVVIDGSRAMKQSSAAIMAALRKASKVTPIHVLFASDENNDISPKKSIQSIGLSPALAKLNTCQFIGGPDNLPYLVYAATQASEKSNSAVLWIHGPQPYLYGAPAAGEIASFFSHIKDSGVPICQYEAVPGPNKIVQSMEDPARIKTPIQLVELPRSGNTEKDLTNLVNYLAGESTLVVPSFSLTTASEANGASIKQGSLGDKTNSVVVLAAADRVSRLISVGDLENATREACRYKIVSPVTGAVKVEDSFVPSFTSRRATNPPEPYAPGLDGAARTLMVHHIQRAFEVVVSQLNRLNAAPGMVAGGGGGLSGSNFNVTPTSPVTKLETVSGLANQQFKESAGTKLTSAQSFRMSTSGVVLFIVRLLALVGSIVCMLKAVRANRRSKLQTVFLVSVGLLTGAIAMFGGFLEDFIALLF